MKVTGYVTPAAVYCAITGGKYATTGNSGAEDEQGNCTCIVNDGSQCDAWQYYNGECAPGSAPTGTTGLIIQPLPEEVCNGQAQAMSHALADLIPTQSEEPSTIGSPVQAVLAARQPSPVPGCHTVRTGAHLVTYGITSVVEKLGPSGKAGGDSPADQGKSLSQL